MKIKVNNYILNNPKIKENKTILNMSDIHSNIKAVDSILKVLRNFKIDYIFIPGDIVDSLNKNNEKEFLDKIIELTKYSKVYISLGNHDSTIKIKEKVKYIDKKDYNSYYFYKKLKNIPNLTLLTENIEMRNINNTLSVIALNLPNEYYLKRERKNIFNKYLNTIDKVNIDNSKLNIVLCHSPINLAKNNKIISNSKLINNTDLILSGHVHGGILSPSIQDIINNHYGLIGPNKKFIQKNAYGIIKDEKKALLISNGVTKISESAPLKKLHKIVNKVLIPEIDLIYLVNGKEKDLKLKNRKVYEV